MKNFLFPIDAKKYTLVLSVLFVFFLLVYWGMGSYLEPLSGGLTRIGGFAENDFGEQQPQPGLSPELFKNYSLAEADIVVIGDSFSFSGVWQTKLALMGYKTSTAKSYQVGFCNNLGYLLRNAGFKGKYIILERLEQYFDENIDHDCKTELNSYKTYAPVSPPPVNRAKQKSLNSSYSVSYKLWTLVNKVRLRFIHQDKFLNSGRTKLASLQDGCRYFSNNLCNYGLFYSGDFNKPTFHSIDKLLSVNQSIQRSGIKPLWLIIPDKSTVYLGYGKYNSNPYVNSWNELAKHPEVAAPNLGKLFTEQAKLTKDFYAPNDTHLSTTGFLFLGTIVQDMIKQLEATSVSQ